MGLMRPFSPLSIKPSFNPGKPPPTTGMQPVGDSGFYLPPDEPVSPFDKKRYPDSPFNGGNPFSIKPIGLDTTVTLHNCGVDFNVKPTVLFIKLPTHPFSYRFPGTCRNEPPKPEPPTFDGYPPMGDSAEPPEGFNPPGISDDDEVIAGFALDRAYENYLVVYSDWPNSVNGWVPWSDTTTGSFGVDNYRSKYFVSSLQYTALVRLNWSVLYTSPERIDNAIGEQFGGDISSVSQGTLFWQGYDYDTREIVVNSDTGDVYQIYQYDRLKEEYKQTPPPYAGFREKVYVGFQHNVWMASGKWGLIKKVYSKQEDFGSFAGHAYALRKCLGVVKWSDLNKPPYSGNPPSSLPPPPEDEPPMDCCDQLLAALKKLQADVDLLKKRMGVDEYPFNVPASIRSEDKGWLGNMLPSPTKKIENVTQFQRWHFDVFEEILGQFEIPIEIKDSDPAKPGDQPQGMKLANVAEAIAEIAALCINTSINSEVLINMLFRNLYETGLTRQNVVANHEHLDCLHEFFGFKTKVDKEKVKFSFTPGKERIDETLKETEVEVAVHRFDDKKKTYKDDMLKLLQAAEIIRAVHSRKLKAKDAAGMAVEIAKTIKGLKKHKDKMDETTKTQLGKDFDSFCEDFERGFTDIPGIDDPAKPFGEEYTQRPRVIRLDKLDPNDNV